MTITYHFAAATTSFKDTLSQFSTLPYDHGNVQALETLPIFGVVLVIADNALNSTNKHPDALMQSWADEHQFLLAVVPKETNYQPLSVDKHSGSLPKTTVFRYILLPKERKNITPAKRETIAHIVDEQITAFFRQKLKPKPNYNFAVNDKGEVDNFELTAPKTQHYLDCHILNIAQMLRQHKLACFDMDSTLIKQEVITELAKMAGVGEQVAAITEQAMRGEIDFATSFGQRVALLKDLPATIIDEIKPLLIPQTGAFVTIAALKAMGYHTVLISGGFLPFAEYIATLLGIDEYHANPLDIADGKLTGEIVAPIIDGKAKAKLVAKIADRLAIDLDEVICIGDGANDLPMMAISDIGMAYRAKPIVQVRADVALNVTGLEGVLYALGHSTLQQHSTN